MGELEFKGWWLILGQPEDHEFLTEKDDCPSPQKIKTYPKGYRLEVQKGGILVSTIPDISGGKSRHFQIVAANLGIFGIKRLQHCSFMTQFKSK